MLIASSPPGMTVWREKLFALVLRGAESAMESLRLPTNAWSNRALRSRLSLPHMNAAPIPAPIIVTALFGAADFAYFNCLRRANFAPERNLVDAHLTLFHHLPPGIAPELKARLAEAARGPAPAATLAGIISLGGGVAFRIESAELDAVRDDLKHAFSGLLTPQDSAGWRAHVTVQNKVEPHISRGLKAYLETGFAPRPIRIAGLAAWWYRGGPWERLSRHMFRG
jgi:hypothetical protein